MSGTIECCLWTLRFALLATIESPNHVRGWVLLSDSVNAFTQATCWDIPLARPYLLPALATDRGYISPSWWPKLHLKCRDGLEGFFQEFRGKDSPENTDRHKPFITSRHVVRKILSDAARWCISKGRTARNQLLTSELEMVISCTCSHSPAP